MTEKPMPSKVHGLEDARENVPIPMESFWTEAQDGKRDLEHAARSYKRHFDEAKRLCGSIEQEPMFCVFQTLLLLKGQVPVASPEITGRMEFRKAAQALDTMNSHIQSLQDTKNVPMIASLEVCRLVLDSEVQGSAPYQIFEQEEDDEYQGDNDAESEEANELDLPTNIR